MGKENIANEELIEILKFQCYDDEIALIVNNKTNKRIEYFTIYGITEDQTQLCMVPYNNVILPNKNELVIYIQNASTYKVKDIKSFSIEID